MNNVNKQIENEKTCRACLSQKGDMRPLFGYSLDDMLQSVGRIEVQANDGLPEFMCLQCVLQVSRAFRFMQQCKKSDRILRKQIQDNDKRQEQYPSEESTSALNIEERKCFIVFPNLDKDQSSLLISTNEITIVNEKLVHSPQQLEDSQMTSTFNITLVDSDERIEDLPVVDETITRIFVKNSKVDFKKVEEEPASINNQPESLLQRVDEAQVETTVSFLCNVCNKSFPKRRIWKRHLKIHDPIKPHVCLECGMGFSENSNLKKHKKKHTGELRNIVGKPNLCSICGKAFKWASSLSKHMNHHTKRKILNCPFCPKYYVEKRTLKTHLRTHTGEKPFVCPICKKGFAQECNLEKHIRVHTGEKPFLCPVCGKGFSQNGYVAVHLRSHTGEKPYMCTECGKCFAAHNSLTAHKKIHTGEKPYPCTICMKSFGRQESAIIHRRIHTGEKPHTCSVCNRGFTSSGNLTIHLKTHTGEKPHQCTICSKKFTSKTSLKNHTKVHSKDENTLVNHTDESTNNSTKQHNNIENTMMLRTSE